MPDPLQQRSDEFLELVAESESRVYGFVRATIRNAEDAEDVYQHSVMVMWEHFPNFVHGTNFAAWACRIAKNRVLQYFQARKHVGGFSEQMLSLLVDSQETGTPDLREEQLCALRNCLHKLTAKDRLVLDQRYIEGDSVASLAARLGRSSQSVCNTLRRIRQQLYRCVESQIALGEP